MKESSSWGWRDWISAASCRDIFELAVLPGLVCLMPWRWAFTVLRWLAFHWSWPYSTTVEAAWQQALDRRQVQSAQERVWKAERRLVTFIDHADLYLSLTRNPTRFMNRWLDVHGQWGASEQAALMSNFHWGAGIWGLHHARAHGLCIVGLTESLERKHFAHRPWLYHYIRARVHHAGYAIAGNPPVDISTSLRPIVQALKEHKHIMATVDVPADRASSSVTVPLLGQPVHIPKALFKLAVTKQIPVYYFITGIDLRTGRRFLRIESLGRFDNQITLAHSLFERLDGLIRESSSSWHLWDQAMRFWGGGENASN